MFCEKCGKLIEEDSSFCVQCGNKVIEDRKQATTQKTTTGKNYASILVGIVVFLLMFFLVKYVVQKGFSNNDLEKVIAEASEEINKDLPKDIDKITQLTSTIASGKELTYLYKITADQTLTQNDLNYSVKSTIINNVCTTSDTKDLLDLGAGLIYSYYDNQGKHIGKIDVHRSDCK